MTKTLNERISGYCQVTLETMAYAGTGDVLKVQKMLSIVGEHVDLEEGEEWKVCLSSRFHPLNPLAFSLLGKCGSCSRCIFDVLAVLGVPITFTL